MVNICHLPYESTISLRTVRCMVHNDHTHGSGAKTDLCPTSLKSDLGLALVLGLPLEGDSKSSGGGSTTAPISCILL